MHDLAQALNLGPRTAARLREVGIETFDQLAEVGAIDAWHRLRFRFGPAVTRTALYALAGALGGYPWQHLPDALKADLDAVAQKGRDAN